MEKIIVIVSRYVCLFIILIGFSCTKSQSNKEDLEYCNIVTLAQDDTIKRNLIRKTISEFVKYDLFRNNRGIVQISIYPDSLGGEKWYITAKIEDDYQRYNDVSSIIEDFHGDLIHYYYEDKASILKRKNRSENDKDKIRNCLEYAIGNRVYQRSTKKKRWSRLKMGERELGGINRGVTGWPATKTVLFNAKGEYTVLNWSYGCSE